MYIQYRPTTVRNWDYSCVKFSFADWDLELSGPTSAGGAASVLFMLQRASRVQCRQSEALCPCYPVYACTRRARTCSLCYPKVYVNRVRVIRRHLCIKPRTSAGPKKFVRVNRGSLLSESVLTKFYCSFIQVNGFISTINVTYPLHYPRVFNADSYNLFHWSNGRQA